MAFCGRHAPPGKPRLNRISFADFQFLLAGRVDSISVEKKIVIEKALLLVKKQPNRYKNGRIGGTYRRLTLAVAKKDYPKLNSLPCDILMFD